MSYTRQDVLELAQNPEVQKAQEDLQQMLTRSATDLEFREKLLNDPRAAFGEFGQQIPDGLDIRFIENQADATFVLPNAIDPAAELSDAQLESVAGGVTPSSPVCSLVVVSATISYITSKI